MTSAGEKGETLLWSLLSLPANSEFINIWVWDSFISCPIFGTWIFRMTSQAYRTTYQLSLYQRIQSIHLSLIQRIQSIHLLKLFFFFFFFFLLLLLLFFLSLFIISLMKVLGPASNTILHAVLIVVAGSDIIRLDLDIPKPLITATILEKVKLPISFALGKSVVYYLYQRKIYIWGDCTCMNVSYIWNLHMVATHGVVIVHDYICSVRHSLETWMVHWRQEPNKNIDLWVPGSNNWRL